MTELSAEDWRRVVHALSMFRQLPEYQVTLSRVTAAARAAGIDLGPDAPGCAESG